MRKKELIEQITNALAILSRKVEISSSMNLTDINVVAEDFYRDLLNLTFGYELLNINLINPNAVSIDLGDTVNRIAIQVTSTSALKKTRETVQKFIKNSLFNDYDRLIILNLVGVTQHRDKFIGEEGVFQIDTKNDILDYNDFARLIAGNSTDKLETIVNFINKDLMLEKSEIISKEVKTIISLIEHLSNFNNPDSGNGFIDKPDPEEKILIRFSDNSEFLIKTYTELYSIYGPNLEIVHEQLDISSLQIKKKSIYLKTYSDKVLNECENNPQIALEELTRRFSNALVSKGIEPEEMAITFFLVDELIRCNIFPNTLKING
jgi:hypothetical protein